MKLLTGNEAIARGAYEARVRVAAAYPGTPSTEIVENIACHYPEIYTEWAPNEKVALEVGIGASLAGRRALVAMKHVGVNVAADPLITAAYTGVNAGLVLISADDPGMHSSQNEQDNRFYARFAQVPLLEPADSQEAKDFIRIALEVSEAYDLPAIVRMTTRVAHSKSLVREAQPAVVPERAYEKNFTKYVMVPANARNRRHALQERMEKLREFTEKTPLNRIEDGDRRVGIVCSGICYWYVKEVFPWAPVLKLGMSYPFPVKLVKEFAAKVENLFVVEELEPFLEEQMAAAGIAVRGKDLIPRTGELTPALILHALMQDQTFAKVARGYGRLPPVWPEEEASLPLRPPVLCPGCPHRGLFYVLKKLRLNVMGDIGCYTLGGLPPLTAMDTCICMGAGIGMAHGMAKADPETGRKTVAVIGDSTFVHSGITGLIDIVYNRGITTVIIADNRTTAMTGHQDHPGTGKTARQEPTKAVDFAKLARALGITRVTVVDPCDLTGTRKAIQRAVKSSAPAVIVARRPCVLLTRPTLNPPKINPDACNGCTLCLGLGCPALSLKNGCIAINPYLCVGCGLCAQVCRRGAIAKEA